MARLVFGGGDPAPGLFLLAPVAFGFEPARARGGGGFRFPATLRRHGRFAEERDEAVERVLAVLLLRSEAACVEHEHAFARHAFSRKADQTPLYALRETGRGHDVEPKLDGGRHLVDVLPAGSRRANEREVNLGLIKNDVFGDLYHEGLHERSVVISVNRHNDDLNVFFRFDMVG